MRLGRNAERLLLHSYVHALVDGIDGVDPEVLDPRLDDVIIRRVPHEDPGRVFDDAVFCLAVEAVALAFIYRALGCGDQAVELRVETTRAVSCGAHAG